MNIVVSQKPKPKIDVQSRSYVEVDVYPDGPSKRYARMLRPSVCAECHTPIHHGFERYFQRIDPVNYEGTDPLARASISTRFDDICEDCGDAALRRTKV